MSISPIGAQDKDKRMKLSVTATTAVAVAGAFAHIAKKQGFSLSPSVIKKTPIKDWAIFKDHNEEWNIICNHDCYKLKDEKIELIKKLDYNNIEFHSSMKYANKTYYY